MAGLTDVERYKQEKAAMEREGLSTERGIQTKGTLDRNIEQARRIADQPMVKQISPGVWVPTQTATQQNPNAYKNFLQTYGLTDSEMRARGITLPTKQGVMSGVASPISYGGQPGAFETGYDNSMYGDYNAELQRLKQAQIDAGIAGLTKQRDIALGGIQSERQALPQRTFETVQRAKSQQAQGMQGLNEYLAQKGLSQSGSAAQGDIAMNIAAQGQIGAANLQEQQDLASLARREQDIQAGYGQDVTALQQGAEAAAMQQALDRQTQLQDRAYEQQQRQAEQARQDYASTVGRYAQDFTAEENRLRAAGVPESDYRYAILGAAKQEKLQNMASAQAKAQQAQTTAQQKAYDDALNLLRVTKKVTTPQQSKILGLPVGYVTSDAEMDKIRLGLDQARLKLAQEAGARAAQRAKTGGQGTKQSASEQYTDFKRQIYSAADAGNTQTALNALQANSAMIKAMKGEKAYDELVSYVQRQNKSNVTVDALKKKWGL